MVTNETISSGTLVADFDNVKLTGTTMLIFTHHGLTHGRSTYMLATGTSQKFGVEID
jgi:hypothetical protein